MPCARTLRTRQDAFDPRRQQPVGVGAHGARKGVMRAVNRRYNLITPRQSIGHARSGAVVQAFDCRYRPDSPHARGGAGSTCGAHLPVAAVRPSGLRSVMPSVGLSPFFATAMYTSTCRNAYEIPQENVTE